jgi:hypothetical protein
VGDNSDLGGLHGVGDGDRKSKLRREPNRLPRRHGRTLRGALPQVGILRSPDRSRLASRRAGYLSAEDPVWPALRLWHDANRDGISQPNELLTLDSLGFQMFDVTPVETRREDTNGNEFRYKSTLWRNGHAEPFYDVYLAQ